MDDEVVLKYMKDFKELMTETLDRVDALEDTLYKKVLEPAAQLQYDYERGQRHDAFAGKHGEQLSSFNDRLKAIEGDDFDLLEQAFNDYDESDHSIAEDDYVAALVAKVQSQLDKISKAFGAGNLEIEAKDEDKDGKTEEVSIEKDTDGNGEGDKTIAAAVSEDEAKENGENAEEKVEEVKEEIKDDKEGEGVKAEVEEPSEGEEPIDTEEEIEADLKELQELYDKTYKKAE